MRNLRHAGLSGKARLKRDRSRASRVDARQWISEYLELGEDAHDGADSAPIGRRAYFLPSAATVGEVTAMEPTQLEFTAISNETPAKIETKPEPVVVAMPARKSYAPSTSPRSGVELQPKFSLRQFAWGCAIGGVAAAIGLTILLAVFG